ncbi:DsrE family protein [Allobranchiibius sp. GilTou38]|uniref:DsrE family protein n=1 Tax=Allobranchiibius sp. GilTou38 TaxID=2815210 RepID=UPI001AA14081|nr:DsrE family protein [Allobranchiibius sp. GilTou38]MBO1766710.1 DsrE family protein [Allobranchiibius sp. GilTou38]
MPTPHDQDPSVVIHLPDQSTLAAGLLSATNIRRELGQETVIEIAVQGAAVRQLCGDSDLNSAIKKALQDGCVIAACGNSLRAQAIDPQLLIDGINVVPSAVAYVAQRQWRGAAYVRL